MSTIFLYKNKDIDKSLNKRIDTFPYDVPAFLMEHEIKYIKNKIFPFKQTVNISFDYNLTGIPISHIKGDRGFRTVDIKINIHKKVKPIPHKLKILQTYSLAKSLFDIKNSEYINEYIYRLNTGNSEIDNFLVDFLVPKEKFLLAFSRTRCINTLACLFNVNEKVIHYRLGKI